MCSVRQTVGLGVCILITVYLYTQAIMMCVRGTGSSVLVCFLGYIPVLSIGVLERQAVGCAVFILSQAMLVCVRGYVV